MIIEKQLENLSGKGKLILAASGKDQDSKETSDSQHTGREGSHSHGVFTFHLLDGLSGKASEGGVITFNSLHKYLEKQMTGAKQKLISVEADESILDTQIAAVPS